MLYELLTNYNAYVRIRIITYQLLHRILCGVYITRVTSSHIMERIKMSKYSVTTGPGATLSMVKVKLTITEINPKVGLRAYGTPLIAQLLDRLQQAGERTAAQVISRAVELYRQLPGLATIECVPASNPHELSIVADGYMASGDTATFESALREYINRQVAA